MSRRPLKVLIADDEEIVRKGLKNIIDWERLGCEICGEASNGEDVLEKIVSLKPAIVMLDINMPVKTGIDVLKEINEHPELVSRVPEFLILSGYSDFEYAQKALNYGAKGYIVKPVDEDELEKKIKSIVKEVYDETEVDTLRTNAKNLEVEKKFSRMFLYGSVAEAFSKEEDGDDRYSVLIVSPELCGCAEQLQVMKMAVQENFMYTRHFDFAMEPMYIILFKNESEESILRHLGRFCNKFQKNGEGSLAAVGESLVGLEGALDSFNQAKKIYEQMFFFAHRPYVTIRDVLNDEDAKIRMQPHTVNASEKEFFQCIPKLIQYIEIYDLQKIRATLDSQIRWLKRSSLTVDQIKKLCMAFIVETQNAIRTKHPEKELETVPALDLVNLIYTQNYFDSMIAIVSDFTLGLAESFTSNTANSTILKVIQYVRANFNTDLKLEMLGNLFNCNSAYLGKKFREYTGVPFNTYMDIIRIEEAKKLLLSSPLKIYEISKLVGYTNTDYFYLKFKKHTNMTPKEFKSSSHGDGENSEN